MMIIGLRSCSLICWFMYSTVALCVWHFVGLRMILCLLACGTFLNDWVAAGHDKGTKSVQWPRDVRLSAAVGCAHSLTL